MDFSFWHWLALYLAAFLGVSSSIVVMVLMSKFVKEQDNTEFQRIARENRDMNRELMHLRQESLAEMRRHHREVEEQWAKKTG